MKTTGNDIEFSESDLKEIFALFSSPAEYELHETYDLNSENYFECVALDEEYELAQEKREFALDALRAVFHFLHRHGCRIEKDGKTRSLESVLNHFR